MDECELIALVTAVACAISKNCSSDDISLLSAVFSQLGDTLATVLAHRECVDNNQSDGSNQEQPTTQLHK